MTTKSYRSIDPTENPTPETLREWLKVETQAVHARADSTEFMLQIIGHNITKEMYRFYLSNLYLIYKAMEDECEKHKERNAVGAVWLSTELSRIRGLEEDLEFYYGPNWRELVSCTESAVNYASRIRVISVTDPDMLVAHSYSRYLGDLSGGAIIKRKIQKTFDLPGDDGVRFYCFDEIKDVKKFKEYYTVRMNAMDVDIDVKHRIKDETVGVFELNINLFNELDRVAKVTGGYKTGKETSKMTEDDKIKETSYEAKGVSDMLTRPYVIQIAVTLVMLSLLPYIYSAVF